MKVFIKILATILLVQVSFVSSWDHPRAATPGQFPHQASIFWGSPPDIPVAHSCGGAVIDVQWILTSGYCAARILELMNNVFIKVGVHNISLDDGHVQILHVARSIPHKKYSGLHVMANLAPYDIGLIKTVETIILNDRVKLANLPKKSKFGKSGYKLQYNGILAGWGILAFGLNPDHPKVLYTVSLPIVPNNVCQQSIRTIIQQFSIDESQLCTRPLDGSFAACIGDYGAPLVQYEENSSTAVIIAVMSWTVMPCDTNGLAPVYIRVPHFTSWISKEMK